MKGLLKNNFYATLPGAKALILVMILAGAFIAAVISQSLLIAYIVLGIIGFSEISLGIVKDEFSSKWGKYKLTMPVKRADIIKSQFLNQLLWMAVGIVFAITVTVLSWLLHGSLFDTPLDTVTTFVMGISMSLFAGALFFPLFYCFGEERGSVLIGLSLVCSFGFDCAIVTVFNYYAKPGPQKPLLGIIILMAASLLAFGLSYPLTVRIFKRREY